LVTGATYPGAIAHIRKVAPSLPFLIPGIGNQGGNLLAAITSATDTKGAGFIVSSSSAIIFAEDPDLEVRKLHDEIIVACK